MSQIRPEIKKLMQYLNCKRRDNRNKIPTYIIIVYWFTVFNKPIDEECQ